MPISVFNTDSVTIDSKEVDRLVSASEEPKALSTFLYRIALVIQKKMLSFATETATVQAQEQRAKDAKSFRRLYASDFKIVNFFLFFGGNQFTFLFSEALLFRGSMGNGGIVSYVGTGKHSYRQ